MSRPRGVSDLGEAEDAIQEAWLRLSRTETAIEDVECGPGSTSGRG